MTEIDLLILGFRKISTRDKKLFENVVGIRYAYQKGNLILFPKKNDEYVYLDNEGNEQYMNTISEVKNYFDNQQKRRSA